MQIRLVFKLSQPVVSSSQIFPHHSNGGLITEKATPLAQSPKALTLPVAEFLVAMSDLRQEGLISHLV